MSTNALIVSVFVALAVAAAALRIATGPIGQLKDGDTLYAMAKSGPAPGPLSGPIEIAAAERR